MRKVIYLAGPISNPDWMVVMKNLHRFFEAERRLTRKGYTCINPANDLLMCIMDGEFTYEEVTGKDLPLVECSDAIYMLSGWSESKGAVNEMAHAIEADVPVVQSDADLDALWTQDWIDDLPGEPDD